MLATGFGFTVCVLVISIRSLTKALFGPELSLSLYVSIRLYLSTLVSIYNSQNSRNPNQYPMAVKRQICRSTGGCNSGEVLAVFREYVNANKHLHINMLL
jgi:hypothetical protein